MGFSSCKILVFLVIKIFSVATSNLSCIKSERDALLKFKQSLSDPSNRLSSWTGEDCCAWEGVGCHNITGHVIKLNLHNPSAWATEWNYFAQVGSCDSSCLRGEINPSLLNLTHLEYFDISMNNFSKSGVPKFIGSLKNLKYLNLGFAELEGNLPGELGNLSDLQYLDLRWNHLTSSKLGFLSSLSSLQHLDLTGLDLSQAGDWLTSINAIPSLSVLHLQNCLLSLMPQLLHVNFTSLATLRLGENQFNSTIPSWLFNISSLEELYLFSSAFHGSIPAEIGNCISLQFLDISHNELGGPLPDTIGGLTSLIELFLSKSSLTGNIPKTIGQLSNLETLDLHDNLLDGIVSEQHFSNLTSLTVLFLNQNHLVFNFDPSWIPPFQLHWLSLSSCKVGPKFPQWLKTQTKIHRIEICNASISDSIPDWFNNISLRIHDLDLSFNQITKGLPKLKTLESSDFDPDREIFLDSNKFEGPLDPFPTDIAILDVSNNLLSGSIPETPMAERMHNFVMLFLSNNHLSGSIPVSLCKMQSLEFLGLATNQLSGSIPKCWQNLQALRVIDVANNNLSGRIPVSIGSLQNLVSLHMENNKFHGEVPASLKNLTNLRALDFSRNSFSSVIPPWIGERLPSLSMLNLHSNKFQGEIPLQLCQLVSLRILNLGNNNLIGAVPRCFGNFTAMINGSQSEETASGYYFPYTEYPHVSYNEHTWANVKGMELEYTKTLKFLFSIDLSENNFTGEIPPELTSLSNLQNLNLSGNNLQGHVPFSIGNLTLLESLDLSRNELCGSIPLSISKLKFLSHLNLSFNNLSGHIPSGNQIQTLDDKSIYIGNAGLCGFPLEKCKEEEPHNGHVKVEKTTEDDDEFERLWFVCGLMMGFTAGFVGVCSILYFKDSWRYAYFRFVERFLQMLRDTFAWKRI